MNKVSKGYAAMVLKPINIANLIFSLHYALILYVNSSYLSQFFSPGIVGLLFITGAVGNIFLSFALPELLGKFGNRKTTSFFLIVCIISLTGLAFSSSNFFIAFLFILYVTVSTMIFYNLDIFLEAVSTVHHTGEIRGIFLTMGNAAIAIAPLLVSYIAPSGEFLRLYVISAALLSLLLIILWSSFRKYHDISDHHLKSFSLPFREWWKNRDIRRVTIARFVLEFFFALMVIYTPIYLHDIIGFEWKTIGLIFAFMLLPFVLFEFVIGEISDRFLGEKEIMTAGFFIMGTSLLFMPFLGSNPLVWAIVLFMSRTGASFIEITADVYFFKKALRHQTGLIAIYRLTRPLPIILGAIVGGIITSLFPLSFMFFALSIVVLLGMFESARIKDTL